MNKPTSFTNTIDNKAVVISGILQGYVIRKRVSSFIDYIGLQRSENKLFIQFNNGNCSIFKDVPKEVLDLAEDSDSIGKFYHSFIKGKYEFDEIKGVAIRPFIDQEEDDDIHDEGYDFDDDLED